MNKIKILLVEDDPGISNMLKEYLESNDFEVFSAYDGEEGLALFETVQPKLVILDVQLPKIAGTEVCRIIRKTSNVPIIMATGLGADIDKILGLELGADDYLAKPFHPRELLARVRNLLKRCYSDEVKYSAFDPSDQVVRLTLNFDAQMAKLDGVEVKFSTTEFKILETIAANSTRVLKRDHLAKLVLGTTYDGGERAIDAHIVRMRKKLFELDAKTEFIETIRGFGYKLVADGIAKTD
ncbi:MAG: response regulator transcription factor [Bacillota bacterium]